MNPPPPPVSRHGFHAGLSPRAANVMGWAIVFSGLLGLTELLFAARAIIAGYP